MAALEIPTNTPRVRIARSWPWLILLAMTIPAAWHVLDFPNNRDGEYPLVVRPTFCPLPPSAYRLAEPGDTIDRVILYASSAALVIAGVGWIASRKAQMWPVAMAVAAAIGWFAATPGPGHDGWHGLSWRAILDPSAPSGLRIALGLAALGLAGMMALAGIRSQSRWGGLWKHARERRVAGLLVVSVALVAVRAIEIPGLEPLGYWPRWAMAWGMIAFGLAMVRLLPPLPSTTSRVALGLGGIAATAGLIIGGLDLIWLHRPLERLHAVVPGRIYISAIPTYRGLEVEQSRLHFKTVINLFDETSHQRSPRLPQELRFLREHGIRYLGSPPPSSPDSDTFLDETLALAQDPSAWPILVHCHGCMDRSPAWMGIYRFVVQGRPLDEILQEIEAHRGVRPKASVTLLYNHVLPRLAPTHYSNDPTASLLKEYARDSPTPYDKGKARRLAGPNPSKSGGVPRR